MSDRDVLRGAVLVSGTMAAGFSGISLALSTALGVSGTSAAVAMSLPIFVFAFASYRIEYGLESRSSRPETGDQTRTYET